MTNEFIVLTSDRQLDDNKFTVEFDKPLSYSNSTQCALFDIMLPEIVPRTLKLTVQLVYCKRFYSVFPLSKYKWNFDKYIIQEYSFYMMIENMANFYTNIVNHINGKLITKQEILDIFLSRKQTRDKDIDNYDYQKPFMEFRNYKYSMNPINFGLQYYGGHFKHKTHKLNNYVLLLRFNNNLNKLLHISDEYIFPTYVNFLKPTLANPNLYILWDKTRNKSLYHGYGLFFIDYSNINYRFYAGAIVEKYNVYILCNITSESYINFNKTNILRYCSFDTNGQLYNELVPIIYNHLAYNYITQISIEFVDENFIPVKFLNGYACIVLHFK